MKKNIQSMVREDEVCVCFNLRKASRIVTQIYDEVMRPLGYRATQITLLGVINRHEGLTVKELAGFIDTDPTTLIRNLRLLEQDRLVRLEPGEDRRERRVFLAERGQQLLGKAYPLWKKTQERIARQVGKDELNRLLDGLSSALQSIQNGKE